MNVVMLNVVTVLSMFVVDIASQGSITCNDLPKVAFPSNEALTKNSPMEYHFALTPLFDCTTKVFTNPARGTTNYDGSALAVKGSKVTAFDYTLDSDGITALVTLCDGGVKSTWYAAVEDFNDDGGSYCLYTCNGPALGEFGCASNNGISSKVEEVVKQAKQVSNGFLIHNATTSACLPRKGCKVF